jgi:hypothetical protein
MMDLEIRLYRHAANRIQAGRDDVAKPPRRSGPASTLDEPQGAQDVEEVARLIAPPPAGHAPSPPDTSATDRR